MSSRYVEIGLTEMKEFLESLGFRMHKRDAQTEWVANKIHQVSGANYVIRVYTSINPDEKSRGSGSDAIRVGLFDGSSCEWCFGTKRVNRTKNWKEAVKNRITEIEERSQKHMEKYDSIPQV